MKKEVLIFGLAILMLVGGASRPSFVRMSERLFKTYTEIEVNRAQLQAQVDQREIQDWANLEARYILPAWGLLHTSVPWMMLVLGWLGVGFCVVSACMVIDAYRIKRRHLTMIWPNSQGELPIDSTSPLITSAGLALLHNRQKIDLARILHAYQSQRLLTDEISQASDGLPVAPSYSELVRSGFKPSLEKFILGYSQDGPVHGTIDELLSVLIIGQPGTGKTTLLRYLLAQLLWAGADVAILDPHGGLSDLANVQGVARWYAEDAGGMTSAINELKQELDLRLAQRKKGKRDFRPLLLLIDEWNILASSTPEAVQVASRFILEARKVRGYAVISGQGAPAKSFGGSVARDALSSRYVASCTKRQARMAGLDMEPQELSDMLAALKEGRVGRAILARASSEPLIVAIPETTSKDLEMVIEEREPVFPEEKSFVPEEVNIPPPNITDEQILIWGEEGLSMTEICRRIRGNRNKVWARVKAVLGE